MDPILFAVVSRFSYRRVWSRGRVTWASALAGGSWTNACGSDATDALLALLARAHGQTGAVDA